MTMEIDALHAGQPMRNSLDPCNTCAEWQQQAERVRVLREPLAWRVKLPRVGGGWHWVLNSHPLDEFQNEPLVTLEAALAYGAACAAEQREDIRTLIMAKHYASQHQHNLYHCLAVELFGDAAIRASAMPEPEPGAETDTRHTAQSPVSPTDAP